MSDWNDVNYTYPVITGKGRLKFRKGLKAALREHGVPDPREQLGNAIKLLSEPGSKARVKWAGDEKWTRYGDAAE